MGGKVAKLNCARFEDAASSDEKAFKRKYSARTRIEEKNIKIERDVCVGFVLAKPESLINPGIQFTPKMASSLLAKLSKQINLKVSWSCQDFIGQKMSSFTIKLNTLTPQKKSCRNTGQFAPDWLM